MGPLWGGGGFCNGVSIGGGGLYVHWVLSDCHVMSGEM